MNTHKALVGHLHAVDATSPSRQKKEGLSVSDATETSRPRGLAAYARSALALAFAVLLGTTAEASLIVSNAYPATQQNVQVSAGDKGKMNVATFTMKVDDIVYLKLGNDSSSTYTPAIDANTYDASLYTAEIESGDLTGGGAKLVTITAKAKTEGTQLKILKKAGSADTPVILNIAITDGGDTPVDTTTFDFGGCTVTVTNGTVSNLGSEPVLTFTKAGSLSLSQEVVADVLVVGGGGSGASARSSTRSDYQGNGGGGGVANYKTSVTLAGGTYQAVIGAGGASAAVYTSSTDGTYRPGSAGGSSSLTKGTTSWSAVGGSAGTTGAKGSSSAGTGGSELSCSISGTTKTYGENGKAGSAVSKGTPGASGTDGEGDGGGGGHGSASGKGGDGIVIVRLKEVPMPRTVIQVPTATTAFDYDGSKKTCVAEGECYTRGGTYEATDAGDYTATVTPKSGYCWPDKTYGAKTFNWSIARAQIAKPTAATGLVYDGTVQTGVAAGDHYTLGGTYAAKDAGAYSATATPDKNYCWPDKTYGAITLNWSIGRRLVTVSVVATNKVVGAEEPIYPTKAEGFIDGDDAEVSWKVWRTNLVEQLDGSLGLCEEIGTYDLVVAGSVAETSNYTITYENGVGAFEILPKPTEIAVPTAVQGLTYDGTVQTGVVAGVGYTLTGEAARNAGNHSATVTPQSGYCWTGGSTESKTVPWFMAQLPITVTPDAGQKKTVGKAYTITFTTNVTMVGSDRFTGALAVDEDVVGTKAIVLGTLAIDDGNEGANYSLTFDDSVTIEVVADGPSMPTDDGTITYDPTKKEVVVTPEDGKKDVEIINMPSDAKAKVPTSVDSVKGITPAQVVVVADATNGTDTVEVDITDAFTVTDNGAGGVKIELNTNSTAEVVVEIGGTKETIKVTPELTETGDAVVEPLTVETAEVDVGAKTIPGLKYNLNRSTELGGETVTVASETAKGTRTKLTDPMKDGKPPQAFYVIEVKK